MTTTPTRAGCGCGCHGTGATVDEGRSCCSQRHCRRDRDCVGRYRDLAGDHVGDTIALPGLCDPDRALLERALPELPELWLQLRAMLVPGSGGDTVGRGSRTSPLPLRVDPLVTADLVADELQRWEQVVRDRMGMAPTPTGGGVGATGAHVRRAAALLTHAIGTLLALAPAPHLRWVPRGAEIVDDEDRFEYLDGVDAAVRLLAAHRTAQRVSGHAALTHWLPAPCPRCETETLRRLDGADYVECTTCGTVSSEDQYHWLTRVLAYDYSSRR